jgi:hypothetical protein
MHGGDTQVGIDQQNPTIGLLRNDTRQVRGNEGFPLLREGARDEQLVQRLHLAYQIKPRPQTAKFLRNERMATRIHVLRQSGVRIPILVLAPFQDRLKNRVTLPNPAGRIRQRGLVQARPRSRPTVENRGAREFGLRETILTIQLRLFLFGFL